jgi:hypothetical protein
MEPGSTSREAMTAKLSNHGWTRIDMAEGMGTSNAQHSTSNQGSGDAKRRRRRKAKNEQEVTEISFFFLPAVPC